MSNNNNQFITIKKMYVLYKNPIQYNTLYSVQYLHSIGITFLPNMVIERNYPDNVVDLPSIYYNDKLYTGLDECISLYEEYSGIDNLLEKANEFKKNNPNYTIH